MVVLSVLMAAPARRAKEGQSEPRRQSVGRPSCRPRSRVPVVWSENAPTVLTRLQHSMLSQSSTRTGHRQYTTVIVGPGAGQCGTNEASQFRLSVHPRVVSVNGIPNCLYSFSRGGIES